MAAYIDEHRSRFRVGPICRVLSESLDCGFLTPRGCRMFRTRPVSRMRAGREALARAVLQIRSDFFMAVYGCGKMHAQLVAQGWDPAGVGRDRVMNIMRGLGIRGVRRGRTPVTTKPAKGTGGRPDLVDGRFEACAPNRLHVAGITYVRMANGSFGCTAFADGVYARRIVGWACAMTMNTQELPLQALGQAISWAASRAARMVLSATATMARSAPARCTPPGLWNMGCCRRPAPSATRTTTPWPKAPTARTGPSWYGGADPSRI